ncbi:uncharacterized protein LOC111346616 [Stylophora pistillata]|uniref:uncharacterized protein LOC111346616 n=1 Tax=Stylophora pistillata TaxID=50429 RepID=UPI000C03FD96|nr:uncharacterized protein LOC111346616 [Stylophora pistillata]
MQVSTALLFTMATLSLSVAIRGSPIFHAGDDVLSPKNLEARKVKQGKAQKRICGISLYGCRHSKRSWLEQLYKKRSYEARPPFGEEAIKSQNSRRGNSLLVR